MMRQTQTRNGPPFSSHPLYKLRLVTIITEIIGLVLYFLAILGFVNYSSFLLPFFAFGMFIILASFIFVNLDLVTYTISITTLISDRYNNTGHSHPPANAVVSPPNQSTPEWPSRRLIIIDFIFAVIFHWTFWIGFFSIIGNSYRYYNSSGLETLEAYANLTNLAASIEHGLAFWKELMARKRSAWLRDLEATPCQNCRHTNTKAEEGEESTPLLNSTRSEAGQSRAGPSQPSGLNSFGQGKVTMPRWARGPNAKLPTEYGQRDTKAGTTDNTVDEPLLITPDESTTEVGESSGTQGYGTLEASVESISSIPETIVKKKDKGKKRAIEI